jgi:hypothetical protein
VAYGTIVHMLLAVDWGVALVFAWHALSGSLFCRINEYAFMAIALSAVWAINFFRPACADSRIS